MPVTLPSKASPSASLTLTRLEPATTCALVTIRPDSSATNPEPETVSVRIWTTPARRISMSNSSAPAGGCRADAAREQRGEPGNAVTGSSEGSGIRESFRLALSPSSGEGGKGVDSSPPVETRNSRTSPSRTAAAMAPARMNGVLWDATYAPSRCRRREAVPLRLDPMGGTGED